MKMTATSIFATSPDGPSTQASAKIASVTPVRDQEEETGTNYSLASDLWNNPPSNAELIHTIAVVSGLAAMALAAFGLGIAVLGV